MARAKWGFDDRKKELRYWSSISNQHKTRRMRIMTCFAFLDHLCLGVRMDIALGMGLNLQVCLMGS